MLRHCAVGKGAMNGYLGVRGPLCRSSQATPPAMPVISSLFGELQQLAPLHGYWVVGLIVGLEALGLPLRCVAADIGGIPRWAQSHALARIPDGQCDWRAHLGYGVRCRRLHLWQSAAATSSRPRAHRTRTRLGRLFWVWLLDPPLRRPA